MLLIAVCRNVSFNGKNVTDTVSLANIERLVGVLKGDVADLILYKRPFLNLIRAYAAPVSVGTLASLSSSFSKAKSPTRAEWCVNA